YNGTEWVNICDAVAGSVSFTSRDSSIHIAATDNNYDLTVGMIDGESIKTATIHSDHLMDGSIRKIKLHQYAVGNLQIDDEVVGPGLTRTIGGENGTPPPGPLTVNLGEGLTLNGDRAIEVAGSIMDNIANNTAAITQNSLDIATTTLINNGNGTFTYTDETGTPITFDAR